MIVGMDSIIPPVVLSTASLLSNVLSSAKNAKELTKDSHDADLKNAVNEVLADVLELRIRLLELDGENRELKAKLAQKEEIIHDDRTSFFFKKGEPNKPLCPSCYQSPTKQAVVYLRQSDNWALVLECPVCRADFRKDVGQNPLSVL